MSTNALNPLKVVPPWKDVASSDESLRNRALILYIYAVCLQHEALKNPQNPIDTNSVLWQGHLLCYLRKHTTQKTHTTHETHTVYFRVSRKRNSPPPLRKESVYNWPIPAWDCALVFTPLCSQKSLWKKPIKKTYEKKIPSQKVLCQLQVKQRRETF